MQPVEPPNQVVTTKTEPAVLGPTTRMMRTALQVIASLLVAIPALAKVFNMSAANTGKVTAAMGALTVLASVLHNLYDSKQATPKDTGSMTVGGLLHLFAIVCFVIVGLMGADWIFHNPIHLFAWLGFGLAAWCLSSVIDGWISGTVG